MMSYFRQNATLPPDFVSHESRRSQYECSIPDEQVQAWRDRFRSLAHFHLPKSASHAENVSVLLVDGFLLYYDARIRNDIDIPLFLRVDQATIKQRREDRPNYVLDDGTEFQDPPLYFDKIIWPAYRRAHANMFDNGDVEHGAVSAAGPLPSLIVFDGNSTPTDEAVNEACSAILEELKK